MLEMMTSLLKDLGEIGTVLGGNAADVKVRGRLVTDLQLFHCSISNYTIFI